MGKNRECVRFCFIAAPDAAKTDLGRAAIHCCRTRHAARRDGFQARYGFQARLLRGEISLHPARCVTACLGEPVTPRAATWLSSKMRLQERLLRAEISLHPDHCIPACPAEPAISASSRLLRSKISLRPDHCVPACPAEAVTPRAATAFRQDTAFKRDYYAVKSHYVPSAFC